MSDSTELAPRDLATRCDPASLGFERSDALDSTSRAVGQDRAVEALGFGLAMGQPGFNLFVLGPTGSGRARLTRALVEARAADEPVPDDLCYVHNFDEPRRPRALRLPPGQGARLRDHMARVVEELPGAVKAVFESTEYRERKEGIEQELTQRHESELEAVAEIGKRHGIAVVRTPAGFALAPLRDGKVLGPEEQDKLSEEEQKELAKQGDAIHQRLHEALKRVPHLQREQRERIRRLDQEMIQATTRELLADVRRAFDGMEAVLEQVGAVEHDIVERAAALLHQKGEGEPSLPLAVDGVLLGESSISRRYSVNLLVDHRNSTGAPVRVVDQPTSGNLVGKVEHLSQLGVLVSDFNLIKPGALHYANGGYVLIDARRLLTQPVSWEQLKGVLRSGEIRVESVAQALDLAQTVSQEPEPVPFRGKVVLIGERWLYHRLSALDPEFDELFKVAAEFEGTMDRTEDACRQYAGLMARVLKKEGLRAMDARAMARMVDAAARAAGHAGKLSMHVRTAFDIMREADHCAGEAERELITRDDVEQAIAQRRRRSGRIREQVQEIIEDGTVRIEVAGEAVGQINGLSVVELPQARFGFPTRITARARLGRGEVVAIDREVQMGGPIHNKGVMILASFLGGRYLPERPLSLKASLVFEQMYGFIDGDSASLAELLALLSAVGELPLHQGVAVTGAIDQHGRVQAVGGLNEKIEGFYDICETRGLDGTQGVALPASNVKNLMLDTRVVEAVASGRFHVWAVETVDQALALCTGQDAGERDAAGHYPEDSANGAIEAKLKALGDAARRALKPGVEEDDDAGHVILTDG